MLCLLFDAATFGRLNFCSQFEPFGLSRSVFDIVPCMLEPLVPMLPEFIEPEFIEPEFMCVRWTAGVPVVGVWVAPPGPQSSVELPTVCPCDSDDGCI